MPPNHADPPPVGLADRVELRLDTDAPRANALPLLVRLLRRLAEQDRPHTLPLRPLIADEAAEDAADQAG